MNNFKKAVKWLNVKTNYECFRTVGLDTVGIPYFNCFIYRIERVNKSSVWFCVEANILGDIVRIKRICV